MRCFACGTVHQSPSGLCPRCGASQDDLPLGAVIGGKWVVEKLLGCGGMGRVYRARHATLNRPFALKVLHHKYLANRNLIKRFKAEALAVSSMDHPNVVSIADHGEDESGLLYITMEYLRGKSLESLALECFPMQDLRLVNIAIQVCRALEEAHRHGIIHRDLKPENVMIHEESDPPDAVKVLDFGLAKALNPEILGDISQITVVGSTCGTPEYMSPEQARGIELDARSDVYAMGVLLYRVKTGRTPFVGRNPVAVASAHVTDPVRSMREVLPALRISPRLEALIYRCLQKNPDARPATAKELRLELEGIRDELLGSPGGTPRQDTPIPDEDLGVEPTVTTSQLPRSAEALPPHQATPVPPPVLQEPGGRSPTPAQRPPAAAIPPQPEVREPAHAQPEPARLRVDLRPEPEIIDSPSQISAEQFLPAGPGEPTAQVRLPSGLLDARRRHAERATDGTPSWEHLPAGHAMPPAAAPRRPRPSSTVRLGLILGAVLIVLAAVAFYLLLLRPSLRPTYAVRLVQGTGDLRLSPDAPWQPLAEAQEVALDWKQEVRTAKDSQALLLGPTMVRLELAAETQLGIGFMGRLRLQAGGLVIQEIGQDPLQIEVEAAGARVVFEGAGPFKLQLLEQNGLEVSNPGGRVAILVASGRIPVDPGRRVIHRLGQTPTYSPIGP